MTLVLTTNVRCDVCRVRSGPEVVVEQQPGEPVQWDEADRLAHAEARGEGWYVDARRCVCPGCRDSEEEEEMSDSRKWCWSDHPEEAFTGPYDTRDEAISQIDEDAAEPCVGRIVPVTLGDLYSVDWLLDTAMDNLWDRVGDVAERWDPRRTLTNEHREWFSNVINQWAERCGLQVSCYAVEDVERVELSDEEE